MQHHHLMGSNGAVFVVLGAVLFLLLVLGENRDRREARRRDAINCARRVDPAQREGGIQQ